MMDMIEEIKKAITSGYFDGGYLGACHRRNEVGNEISTVSDIDYLLSALEAAEKRIAELEANYQAILLEYENGIKGAVTSALKKAAEMVGMNDRAIELLRSIRDKNWTWHKGQCPCNKYAKINAVNCTCGLTQFWQGVESVLSTPPLPQEKG
jgi:hypothetical protein